MPKGHYFRPSASITSLRNELMSLGAESRFRELQDQLRDSLRVSCARRLQSGADAEPLPLTALNGAGPAPEALQLFQQRKTSRRDAPPVFSGLPKLLKKRWHKPSELTPYLLTTSPMASHIDRRTSAVLRKRRRRLLVAVACGRSLICCQR